MIYYFLPDGFFPLRFFLFLTRLTGSVMFVFYLNHMLVQFSSRIEYGLWILLSAGSTAVDTHDAPSCLVQSLLPLLPNHSS